MAPRSAKCMPSYAPRRRRSMTPTPATISSSPTWITRMSEFGGMALPAIPHGMNDCQHATVCAIFSALNRQPAHEAFLRHMLGITEREIRRATVAQVAYQAACRGIIRKAGADGRFLLLLPDEAIAEDCAAIPHFQGCRM